MAQRRRKPQDYPEQVVTKRGIVELHMSPASMHEFLTQQAHVPADQVVRIAREQVARHPNRETFWKLVAYIAMSDGA